MATSDAFAALRREIAAIPVVDTHEHLPNEADRLKQPVDFYTLFSHYCIGDLLAAGGPADLGVKLADPKLSVAEKWALFEPWYRHITEGSYARCAHLAMRRFYDMDRLASLKDAEALTERIRKANKPGLYRRVLKTACGIVTSLNNGGTAVDREFFTPVRFVTDLAEVGAMDRIRAVEKESGRACTSLARYVQALGDVVEAEKARGLKGLKFSFAYTRPLHFASVPAADAERVFNRVFDESQGWRAACLGYDEARPLQDYLVHQLVALAGDLDLTAVFHTGIQAFVDNNLDNCRPERLWNLLFRYRKTRFDIFHIGLPWVEEAGMLAKYFSHVWVDFAWAHAISPEIATQALKIYVDMVPRNKVLGFGGDYAVVEKVYGHLELARDNIARALAGKVAEGALDKAGAAAWARAILHDNPIAAYKLDIKRLD
jgi:predicted TIM-barrel fold metal-dependent hydrolase